MNSLLSSARQRAGRPLRSLPRWVIVLLPLALGRPLTGQETTVSPHGPLKTECRECHGAEGWKPVRISPRFNHAAFNFPLRGAHKTAACMACHQELTFSNTATQCVDCHRDSHRGELGASCDRCHSLRAFNDRSVLMRLHETTRFPLQGAHLAIDCESCHAPAAQGGLQFVALSARCVSCHEQQFLATRSPDHVAGGFDRTCELCHEARVWNQAHFFHRLALTGAHRALTCDQCHVNHRYQGTPADCVGCHQRDYDQTTQPNHVQVGFLTQCATCHATTSWTAPYDHNRSRFPLTGAHRSIACAQCHGDGVYTGKPTTCAPCHQPDYDRTTNPRHTATSFPVAICNTCHTTTAWRPSPWAHPATIPKNHQGATCIDCHTNDADYKVFSCFTSGCHVASQVDGHHRGVSGYVSGSSIACYRCHPSGRGGD